MTATDPPKTETDTDTDTDRVERSTATSARTDLLHSATDADYQEAGALQAELEGRLAALAATDDGGTGLWSYQTALETSEIGPLVTAEIQVESDMGDATADTIDDMIDHLQQIKAALDSMERAADADDTASVTCTVNYGVAPADAEPGAGSKPDDHR